MKKMQMTRERWIFTGVIGALLLVALYQSGWFDRFVRFNETCVFSLQSAQKGLKEYRFVPCFRKTQEATPQLEQEQLKTKTPVKNLKPPKTDK